MQWLNKHKLAVFIGSVIVVFVGSIIIRLITPTEIPIQENSWGSITPGYSKIKDVNKMLGEPINSTPIPEGKKSEYQSTYPAYPHEVVADDSGTVILMKENVDYTKAPKLTDFVQQFGQYDLELYEPAIGYSVNTYVFLQKGVVIVAHIADGSVEQIWRFVPTTKEIFLASWGKSLTDTMPDGEIIEEFPPAE